MQIKITRVALVAAVSGACLAAAVLAPTASGAASGYTLSKGGAVKAASSGNLVFHDVRANQNLTCKKFAGSGTAKKGSHKFVPKTYKSAKGLDAAGALTKHPLTSCSNPLAGNTTVSTHGTWSLGFSSKSKSGATGYMYNVSATAAAGHGTGSGGCVFTSKGAVYGTYSNSTGVFTGSKTAGLVLSGVKGGLCSLVGIKNGDTAYLAGKIRITPKLTVK